MSILSAPRRHAGVPRSYVRRSPLFKRLRKPAILCQADFLTPAPSKRDDYHTFRLQPFALPRYAEARVAPGRYQSRGRDDALSCQIRM
jgi:hypothetical protein